MFRSHAQGSRQKSTFNWLWNGWRRIETRNCFALENDIFRFSFVSDSIFETWFQLTLFAQNRNWTISKWIPFSEEQQEDECHRKRWKWKCWKSRAIVDCVSAANKQKPMKTKRDEEKMRLKEIEWHKTTIRNEFMKWRKLIVKCETLKMELKMWSLIISLCAQNRSSVASFLISSRAFLRTNSLNASKYFSWLTLLRIWNTQTHTQNEIEFKNRFGQWKIVVAVGFIIENNGQEKCLSCCNTMITWSFK